MTVAAGPKLLVALDYAVADEALALAKQLNPEDCRLKVGKELFTQAGPGLVRELQALGFDIFLDLKFHDIPNTVAKAVRVAAELGVWMVNVHAGGGSKMMIAAKEAIADLPNKPLLIAVTVLTSMSQSDLQELGVQRTVEQQVMHLAQLAQSAGLDGIVCSAQEAALMKKTFGDAFLLVTPGIRPAGSAVGDQHRVVTPVQAVQLGSDFLVVGRPITQADNPLAACREVADSIQNA